MALLDFPTTLRDVLRGIGAEEKWMRSEEEVQAVAARREQMKEQQAALDQMQQGADVAQKLGVQADQFAEGGAL